MSKFKVGQRVSPKRLAEYAWVVGTAGDDMTWIEFKDTSPIQLWSDEDLEAVDE